MKRATTIALMLVWQACCMAQVTLQRESMIQADEVLVTPEQDLVLRARAPDAGEDERLLLGLEQRLDVPGGGGCNWVLQVSLNGRVLSESMIGPRLLNKPGSFGLKGTGLEFDWYSRTHRAWMTLFSPDYDRDLASGDEDYRFLWDIDDYVEPGQELELRLTYAQKGISAALKREAPLAVRKVRLGVLGAAEVEALRSVAQSGGRPPREVEIVAAPAPGAQPGPRAYEVQWAKRAESPRAQVGFDDLADWSCTVTGDAEVAVSVSVEQLLWRDQNARLQAEGGELQTTAFLRPPAPIAVAGEWDAADLWVFGTQRGASATRPPPLMVAILRDAAGMEFELDLGPVTAGYWVICHGMLDAGQRAAVRFPVEFLGLVVGNCQGKEPTSVLLESLAFYPQNRRPYARSPRPENPVFPTSPNAMLPTPPPGCKTAVTATADGARLQSTWDSGTVRYDITPRTGTLDDVKAGWVSGDVGREFTPMAGGGLRLVPGQVSPGPSRLRSAQVQGQAYITHWRSETEGLDYSLRYAILGATLTVEVQSDDPRACGVDFGAVRGLPDVRGVEVPYLMMGQKPWPLVACGAGLFVSCLRDWINCDCSSAGAVQARAAGDDGLVLDGGTLYLPLTDGMRNPVRDRLALTVSPVFEDVLPNVCNPPSARREEAAKYLYYMGDGPQPKFWAALKGLGLDHVMAMHFGGIWWQRGGEGFSMRHRPRPEMSEADLAEYREQVKANGFPFGLLVEYTDFFPCNEYWDPNLLSLTSVGAWGPAWYGHFSTKPNAYAELANRVGTLIRSKYPTDAVYLDVHTNVGLQAKDYEVGVPGAGKAAATVLHNGEGILEVGRQHGIVCSEGIYRWLYAGLTDMDYATWWVAPGEHAADKPLLPDFDLLKIHPYAHGTGMSYSPAGFFSPEEAAQVFSEAEAPRATPRFYQYVTATIAHGHQAILGYGFRPRPARMLHYYSLLQGLQTEYLTDSVVEVLRHDGTGYVTTSQMLREGGIEQGRIRIGYSRGLQVWVNYHETQSWTVEVDGRLFELPPYGWVAHKPGALLAFSALVGGERLDYVRCPEYVYVNAGGVAREFEGVKTDGALLLRRDGEQLRITRCGDLGRWQQVPGERYPYYSDAVIEAAPKSGGCTVAEVDGERLTEVWGR